MAAAAAGNGAGRAEAEAALSLAAVSKHFGPQLVLDDFALSLPPGEVRGLVGHNGSGKSTLVKILAGFHKPDPGAGAKVGGSPLALGDSQAARDAGLRFVHQDLGLVGNLDAVDNLHLDVPYPRRRSGRIAWRAARRQTVELLASLGYEFDVRRPIEELAPADRTGVALARALSDWEREARVLVLDEPTAALPVEAVTRLFDAIRAVSGRGIAVIYISHHLDELFEICDELTVLREGRTVASVASDSLDHEGLVELMLGKQLQLGEQRQRRSAPGGGAALVVRDLASERIDGISFAVGRGEVLGVAGLAGSGREDLAAALYGSVARSGSVSVEGREVPPRPDASVRAGMGLVPAHRLRNGLIGTMSVRENLTVA
ncbi:MAG TPA: ATP-binding cassette domain-containing protein, partial [Solirubrobacterales bacterium]|nr:ATP-binding cassette domain-containing protein [Solirubrobacterales bacterium]